MKVSFSQEGHILVDGEPCGGTTSARNISLLRHILTCRGVATWESMIAHMYPRDDCETEHQNMGVRIALTKLRKALGPHQAMIQNRYGEGYFRDPEYQYDKEAEKMVTVSISEDLITRVSMFYDCNADQVVAKLLKREVQRHEL